MGWLAVILAYLIGKGLRADTLSPVPSPVPPPQPRHRQTSPGGRVPVPPRPARRGTTPAPAPAPRPTQPAALTVPWPQVVPSGLPAFPGAGWEPDNPPPSAVVARANQLLSPLWQGGEGTFKAENTAGRWIVYRATQMGDKKGVVAFRESQHAAFLTPDSGDSEPVAPAASRGPIVRASTQTPPGSDTASLGLPLLKLGSGFSGGPDNASVKIVQQKLGLAPVDGKFGTNTDKAVRAFQARNGLVVDGKVGNNTWAALLGRSA